MKVNYKTHFYCIRCEKKIPKRNAEYGILGEPRCPTCNRKLRTRKRCNDKKKNT